MVGGHHGESMTTPQDRKLVPAARKMLEKKLGAISTLRSVSKGAYSTAGGKHPNQALTDYEVKASPPAPVPLGFVGTEIGNEPTVVTRQDVIAFMAADGAPVVPKAGDKFAHGEPPLSAYEPLPEPSFAVLSVEHLFSGDQTAAYRLVMRP